MEAARKPDARYLAGPARFLGHPGPFPLPKRAVSEAEGVDPFRSCAILSGLGRVNPAKKCTTPENNPDFARNLY